jgi:hypothetical protein
MDKRALRRGYTTIQVRNTRAGEWLHVHDGQRRILKKFDTPTGIVLHFYDGDPVIQFVDRTQPVHVNYPRP